MRHIFLLLVIILGTRSSASAQMDDKAVEALMNKRLPSYEEIAYNTVSLMPRLYREEKMDTLSAVVDYYLKNFGINSLIVPFIIVDNIKNRSFRESLRNLKVVDTSTQIKLNDGEYYEENIMTFLDWYKNNCKVSTSNRYSEVVKSAYGEYFRFIKELATNQLLKPYLSPLEKFMLNFFSNPSDAMYDQLTGPEFDGTALQSAYIKYSNVHEKIHLLHLAGIAGAWIPQGNLSLIGTHPYLGGLAGYRADRWSIDLDINFKFLQSANYYLVKVDNNLYNTNHFFGGYIGVDGAYELYRKNRHEISALAGVAYDGFDVLQSNNNNNNSNNNSTPNKTLNAFNLNLGGEYKIYLKHYSRSFESDSYIGMQVKYNIVHYDNSGGTNLDGNTWTAGLIYGSFNKRRHRRNNEYIRYSIAK